MGNALMFFLLLNNFNSLLSIQTDSTGCKEKTVCFFTGEDESKMSFTRKETYIYDKNGLPVSLLEELKDSIAKRTVYKYDEIGRIIKVLRFLDSTENHTSEEISYYYLGNICIERKYESFSNRVYLRYIDQSGKSLLELNELGLTYFLRTDSSEYYINVPPTDFQSPNFLPDTSVIYTSTNYTSKDKILLNSILMVNGGSRISRENYLGKDGKPIFEVLTRSGFSSDTTFYEYRGDSTFHFTKSDTSVYIKSIFGDGSSEEKVYSYNIKEVAYLRAYDNTGRITQARYVIVNGMGKISATDMFFVYKDGFLSERIEKKYEEGKVKYIEKKKINCKY